MYFFEKPHKVCKLASITVLVLLLNNIPSFGMEDPEENLPSSVTPSTPAAKKNKQNSKCPTKKDIKDLLDRNLHPPKPDENSVNIHLPSVAKFLGELKIYEARNLIKDAEDLIKGEGKGKEKQKES